MSMSKESSSKYIVCLIMAILTFGWFLHFLSIESDEDVKTSLAFSFVLFLGWCLADMWPSRSK